MKKTIFILICIFVLGLALTACKQECVHVYTSAITEAATCTREGVETFTCSGCGDSYTHAIPMVEHAYGEAVVELEATCTQEGHSVATCANCDQTKQTVLEKLPHTLENPTILTEPDCVQAGEETGTCTVCGAEDVVQPIGKNDAHVFENTVIREATCSNPGEGTDTCTLCGHTQTCTYELKAHSFTQEEAITAATCTAEGAKKVTCDQCGATEDRKVSALGHKWTGANCQKAAVCSRCNATGKKGDHDYETISSRGDATDQYFAQEVQKRCKICGEEKMLYYAQKVEFDLEKVREVLVAYAKNYGFVNFSATIDDSIIASQKSYKVLEVFKVDWYKEPVDELIALGKQLIDSQYRAIKNSTYPMANRELQIKVSYGASASVGTGMFRIDVARKELT